MEDKAPEFVSVSTPGGSKQMTLAPFNDKATHTPKKRKADHVDKPSSSPEPSGSSSSSPPSDSWLRNLTSGGGFWGNAYWYDLQLERRLPQAKPMLSQLVLALPPCDDKLVLDLCAGSGRASAAVLEAYPTAHLALLDSSKQRLEMAADRLEKLQPGARYRAQFATREVTPTQSTELWTQPVDVVVGCLAFHVVVERPAHYAQPGEEDTEGEMSMEDKYEQLFRVVWRSLRPGGHIVFADHVGQLSLFKQLNALERAGFEDVDCAWCVDGSFVGGGRKPLD
ncbi:hypothetical protein PHYSODRAFT_313483 [Phytophthora sojae]|uniref:Methyltransferase type 12 domain-containing protein n=1 Tax=Phytophthora sojae (strain P6497) TaxID=1094619 RepID=G4Z974_PHYSP|nr:hypothetical protein PHYSODRAFT_313483 [Phytophthora sojae]EGZ21128.1 hypothetical protein PHYSODRAFT_313483 [Phytophthora sojae]|eukprot:XP_009523845.1 hypothetical protein PHYSODRAFT_313483 [Phytophthora sojae]